MLRQIFLFLLIFAATSAAAGPCKTTKLRAINIHQDMTYIAARKHLIRSGFKTGNIPKELGPLGYDDKDNKVTQDCYGSSIICNKYPEIRTCVNFYECIMQLHDSHNRTITIVTNGNILENNAKVSRYSLQCD